MIHQYHVGPLEMELIKPNKQFFTYNTHKYIEKFIIRTQSKNEKKKCAHGERATHTQKDKNRIYRMNKYTILGLFWSVTHSLCAHIFYFIFFCSNYEFHYI